MKKVRIFRVLLVLLLLFSSCNSGVKRVGIFLYNQRDPFIEGLYTEMESQFTGTLYHPLVYDAQNSQVVQNEQIERMLDNPVDLVIINPVDRLGAYALIRKMKEENIPVIFFNREPLEQDLALWDRCFYVGATAEPSGQMQAKLLMELFGGDPEKLNHYDLNGDGQIQGVILRGEQSHQDSEIRTREVRDTFADGNYTFDLLTSVVANWKRIEAYDKMDEILNLYKDDLEVVISNNDEMALGAIERLVEWGYFQDQNGDGQVDRQDGDWIPVVGIDGLPEAVESIEQGYLYGTIINDSATQARAIVDLAGTILSGRAAEESSFNLVNGTYIWNDYYPYLSD